MRRPLPHAYREALAFLTALALLGAPLGAAIAWYRYGRAG